MSEANTFVILAAAGQATRFRASSPVSQQTNKVYLELKGRPVWQHCVEKFRLVSCIGQIYMVVSTDAFEFLNTAYASYLSSRNVTLVLGGSDRWESVNNGLLAIRAALKNNDGSKFVAVHDAARPCFAIESVQKVISTAQEYGAAILAQPIWGTIKRVDADSNISETVPRANLYQATTPQVSRLEWMLAAYSRENIARESATTAITDDAQLLNAAGYSVRVVPDSYANLKITTAEDFALAEAILR